MSRSSPGVHRVAAILNFIADHPGQAFALTDLVRALKVSRATCHALLTGLVDVGYLYRTGDKTYVLGPALAAIGRTAAEHFSPLQVAQPEMRRLADELDVVCGAYFLEGDTVHLRDRAASASHVGYPIPLGNRHLLPVTLAPVFLPQREALAWFEQRYAADAGSDADADAARRAHFAATLAFIDGHGFTVIVYRPGFGEHRAGVTAAAIGQDAYDVPVETLGSLEPETSYRVAAIFASIRAERGGVSFALGLAGFLGPRTGAQLDEAGQRLRTACGRISSFVSGEVASAVETA